jgi:AsmA protein
MQNFGITPPVTADKTVLGKAKIEMAFNATTNTASLSSLVVKLDDTTLNGNASISNFQKPAIRFAMNVDDIDVDRYLPPVSKEKKAEAKSAAASKAGKVELPMKMLRGLDVKGSFKVGKMKAVNLHSQKIEMHVLAKSGLIRVHPARAEMYGGSYSGDLQLDVRGSQPILSMDEKITGVQAGPLFKDAADMSWISGKANLTAKMKGTGLVYEEMRKTLNGNLSFAFEDGSINGVNIPLMIRKAYATLKGLPAPPNEPEKTDFSSVTGTATVRNGVVNNPDLVLSSPLIRVKGSGTADLPKEQVNYLVKTEIVASLKGQGGESMEKLKGLLIPVRIQGPFSKPKFKVEMDEVFKEAAKKKVEEKVKKKLDDKFKDKFKGLFR